MSLQSCTLEKKKFDPGRWEVSSQHSHFDGLPGSHKGIGELPDPVRNPQCYYLEPKAMRLVTVSIGLMARLKMESGSIQSAMNRSIST